MSKKPKPNGEPQHLNGVKYHVRGVRFQVLVDTFDNQGRVNQFLASDAIDIPEALFFEGLTAFLKAQGFEKGMIPAPAEEK